MKTPKSDNDGLSFIEDQYFESSESKYNESQVQPEKQHNGTTDDTTDLSFIDGQYFESSEPKSDGSLADQMNQHGENKDDLIGASYFDRQYFEDVQRRSSGKALGEVRDERDSQDSNVDNQFEESDIEKKVMSPRKILTAEDLIKENNMDEMNDYFPPKKIITAENYAIEYRNKLNINSHLNPDSSFFHQYVQAEVPFWSMKRQQPLDEDFLEDDEEFLDEDSEQTYVPINRTLPYNKMTYADMTAFLRSCIVYHDRDFLAINKPYGLPCQVGEGSKFNMVGLLAPLCDVMKLKSDLHLVHRIDKNVTGALLFAKHEEAAKRIKKMFKDRDIEKRYLAVTAGIPQVLSRTIRSPIENYFNQSLKTNKMFLTQDVAAKGSANVFNAVTKYEVVSKRNGASLMYCYPITGYRHQIRTHLSQALGCPVLGDHKYSSPAGNKPQVLSKKMLERFNMKKSKTRHLMMHLHSERLRFNYPTDSDPKKTIDIMVPVHKHFMKTIQILQLFIPNAKRAKMVMNRVPFL